MLAGCTAHEEIHASTAVDARPSRVEAPSSPQESPRPEAPAVPLSRPRLSQTLTLGQGAEPTYTPAAAAPATGAASGGGSSVVVNNNIVVQPGAPAYYGGYGSYGGYGGYGSYGGYGAGRTTGVTDSRGRGTGGATGWSSTGWEGPRRTAAPGQTPGVGGNWSPPPSSGPATMK